MIWDPTLPGLRGPLCSPVLSHTCPIPLEGHPQALPTLALLQFQLQAQPFLGSKG